MPDDAVSRQTGEVVLEQLGFGAAPEATLNGLNAVYRAWCLHVPFDNVRKRIALTSEDPNPLPGGAAEDFFEGFLRDGVSGTCRPSSNGLYALLRFCGFDARRVSASMMEGEDENHGSVIVTLDGAQYVVDSSLLTNAPVPLQPGERMEMDEQFHETIVEPAGKTWGFETRRGMADVSIAFRLLHDPVDHARYLDQYERSREVSIFNAVLYATRNLPDRVLTVMNDQYFEKTSAGVTNDTLPKPRRRQALIDEFGYSPAIVDRLLEIEAD